MKKVKIQNHGTAYFLRGGELCGNPLLADGNIDEGTEFSIEDSPEAFREGHVAALNKLGVKRKNIARCLNTIIYG